MEVLIADDSATSRRILEAALQKWGYDVRIARDGLAAWELLQRDDAPRMAILDWMMPGLSGPEVCRLVRQQGNNHYTYILLLTSKNEKEDLIKGLEAGADDYLTKPFDQNELKVRLGPGRRIIELQAELLATQAELREQATKDSLTKLYNRHTILEIFDRELARARRESNPVGVVLGDLDRFKSINDTLGHLAGDAVLRETARRMLGAVRPYDAAGRYGGEEFLLILPGCDVHAAGSQAERMRQAIEAEPIRLSDSSLVPVTVSFGVTALPRGSDASALTLISFADQAMYLAKEQGRNRVVLHPFGRDQEKSKKSG